MAAQFRDKSPPDLSGLEVAIRLKAELLQKLAPSEPSSWPVHILRFVTALEDSQLRDKTALLVLLIELRGELRLLSGISEPGRGPSTAALRLPLEADLSRSELLARFKQEVVNLLLSAVRPKAIMSPIVLQAKRIMDQRYAEPLTLDLLEAAVGRSKRHLASVFRREVGVTVHGYLTRVRLRCALALIREGEKIEAVSLLVGYRSKKNFYRQFKAHVGATPVAYRAALLSIQPPRSA